MNVIDATFEELYGATEPPSLRSVLQTTVPAYKLASYAARKSMEHDGVSASVAGAYDALQPDGHDHVALHVSGDPEALGKTTERIARLARENRRQVVVIPLSTQQSIFLFVD